MKPSLLLLLLGGCLVAPVFAAVPVANPRPNIVFFLVDDLGYMDVGANNPNTFYETPHIDRLAKQGMRFTAGYAACPVCSPTRASIMTGRYPQRSGVTDYIGAAQPDTWKRPTQLLPAPYQERLALEETTLAEAFKAAGYATFFAGKWHLGPEGCWPENQGFDINKGGCDRGGPYGGKKYFSPYDNPRLPDGPPGEHLPDRLATETVAFIEANRERPFLAYLSFYSVHTPLMARADLKAKYEAKAKTLTPVEPVWGREREREVRLVQNHAVYAGMVEAMDQAVGNVLAALDRAGLAERTVVVFTSDNGGLSTSEGHPTSNVPLRGGKGWLYEGGIREPWIIRAPGVTQPGSLCDTPVCSVDFYPTLLDLAGAPLPQAVALDGRSLVPLLKGESQARGPLFWHYPHYGNQGGAPGGAVRDGDWKLIEWYEDGSAELFNLRDDDGEAKNLAAEQPDRVKALRDKLCAWRKDVNARMPTPNPMKRKSD
jgi:arylsulfatase A-like enzyme